MTGSGPSQLVSVIMPVFNGGQYVGQAIESVLCQSHPHLELLIVNDGSTDDSEKVIQRFSDSRIRYYRQDRRGVSAARNKGLAFMQGEFYCFLDADDVMPDDSIESRLRIFQQKPELSFVDGGVEVYDANMRHRVRRHQPAFTGPPLKNLLRLSEKCFFGPSWMVRRRPQKQYWMNENLTHGEDLLFYMELARGGGIYGYTPSSILKYRRHAHSAMGNLDALHLGYRTVFSIICQWPETTMWDKFVYGAKVKRIMFLSYLASKRYGKAFLSVFK